MPASHPDTPISSTTMNPPENPFLAPSATALQLAQEAERQLLAAAVSYGHGTTCARDEAAWLVLHALQWPLDADLHGEAGAAPVPAEARARVAALLQERLTTRKPLAYLIRQAWLQGVPFYVDERAIVPRSLLAEALAEGQIDAWLPGEPRRVLDLCTGGGSLAVLAALAWPDCAVDAADLSADALQVAQINAREHGLQTRITLLQGDGLAACQGRAAYDLILCNPPYVSAESMATLPPEYRAEPHMALSGNQQGGCDGMDFIRPLLQQAAAHMQPQAALALEIGHERAYFEAAFPRLNPVWLPTNTDDDQALLLTREELLRGLDA